MGNMTPSVQNWQSIFDYIRLHAGADIQQLELNEYDIKRVVESQVLEEFNRYAEYIDYFDLYSVSNEIDKGINRFYQIDPEKYDRKILRIREIYMRPTGGFSEFLVYTSADIMSVGYQNYLSDMTKSMVPLRTWKFHPPNTIEIIYSGSNYYEEDMLIVEAAVAYSDTGEIPTDLWPAFKDLAAYYILTYIANIRDKYASLTTPQGEIRMDTNYLRQAAMEMRRQALEVLENNVPERFLWFIH